MEKKRTKEFREYVVKLVLEEHRKVTDLAYELEIGASSIHRWIKEHREQLASGNEGVKYVTPSDLKKIESGYEKKLRALEEENAILKKAMHIFTKNQA
jgi:transposase